MLLYYLFSFFFFLALLPWIQSLPAPDPASIQPFFLTQSPPATIPAFPEQSNVAGCPLDLPDELFQAVKSACSAGKPKPASDPSGLLHRSRCCPVLAAWLYSAYSQTALAGTGRSPQTTSYDLPLLPDDSETCVSGIQKALADKGVELAKPNETCDVVYCYCGIRLHPLSCPAAFSVSDKGKLAGDERVKRLERDCSVRGINGCNKCLTSLYQLEDKNGVNGSKSEERTNKMQNRDCQLMGLTWLLAKNRSTYIRTVSQVLRALMMSTDGSDPRSCTLNSDGMPLAVDSSEFNYQFSSPSSSSLHVSSLLSVSVSLVYLLMWGS